MKRLIYIIILLSLVVPVAAPADTTIGGPAAFNIAAASDAAVLSWKNPDTAEFAAVELFRTTIPIEEYFTHEAVAGLCDKIYEGGKETYADIGLAVNLDYYYIIFARNHEGGYSRAKIAERLVDENGGRAKPSEDIPRTMTLSGESSETVNQVTYHEAGLVYNFNQNRQVEMDDNSRRLALFIIVKSPYQLEDNDKEAISYFINEGTPTTIILGSGERAGVLNSYLSAFEKLPTNRLEWQDVIKIANGRWPEEKNLKSEQKAADEYFSRIYQRQPDMDDPNDNAAVTVIAYGLRPANRNLESEKAAINIFKSIFDYSPARASDWDIVRAIAYSGAVR